MTPTEPHPVSVISTLGAALAAEQERWAVRYDDAALSWYVANDAVCEITARGTRAECEAWVNERCAEAVVRADGSRERTNALLAAIEFALKQSPYEGHEWLRCWTEGEPKAMAELAALLGDAS